MQSSCLNYVFLNFDYVCALCTVFLVDVEPRTGGKHVNRICVHQGWNGFGFRPQAFITASPEKGCSQALSSNPHSQPTANLSNIAYASWSPIFLGTARNPDN